MPPTGQQARQLLAPGDKRVLDANGVLTGFGKFTVHNDAQYAQANTGVIMGIYGKGGNGKTTLICSIADPKLNPDMHDLPMAVLDSEAGIKSVTHLLAPGYLDLIPIPSISAVEDFIDLWSASPKNQFPWRSILFDNLSDWVQKALKEQGFHGKDSVVSSQPDYNAMTTRLTVILQNIRDLATEYNVNCFFNLWEMTEKSDGGLIIGRRADLTPKLAIRVMGILDYVGYLSVVNNPPHYTRKLDFSPNPEQDTKTRRRPDEASKDIPLELYSHDARSSLMVDLLNTIKRGVTFNRSNYIKRPSITGR